MGEELTMRKRDFETAVEKAGCTVRFDTVNKAVHVDPPAGHVFSANGLHFITQMADGPWRLCDVYADIAEDLVDGIEACDCDECH